MTEFTKQQLALIERHRDWNVDHDWWEFTFNDFIEVAATFGISTSADDMQFSGFWSQGDGASFTFDYVNAYDVIMAALKVEQEKPFGDPPTGYAAEFAALGKLLIDAFSPYVLTCPEGRRLAEAYQFRADRINRHYSHSRTVRVDAECDHQEYNVGESDDRLQVWNALASTIFGVESKHRHEREPSLEELIDDQVECIANALYKELETEYEYLTSDEAVWEALEANDVTVDEGEEEELEEAA